MVEVENPDLSIFLPAMTVGGSKQVALKLAKYFDDNGYEVEFVLSRKEGALLERIPRSIGVTSFDTRVLYCLPKLVQYLRNKSPSSLLSACDSATLVSAWAGQLSRTSTKIVLQQGSMRWDQGREYNNLKHRIIPLLLRHSIPFSNTLVAVSNEVADNVALNTRMPNERIETIYNPAHSPEDQELAKEPVDHEWFDRKAPVILGVGRLTPPKNFSLLIEAFDIVNSRTDVRLVILGDGPLRGELEQLIVQLDLEDIVDLPGFVDNPYKYMARADVFVLSSEREGFGNVVVEALGCGTPVVSTDCQGGPPEILGHGKYGRLVPVGDPTGLADGICEMLEFPTERELLLERAEDFNIEVIGPQYEKVLFENPM